MAKEKIYYKDIIGYILGNQATKDFEAIGPREDFLARLGGSKKGQEAKLQKKKAATKEGDAPDLEQPKKKEREEKSPEQAYEAKVHSKSNDIRAKFASHKDDPKFRAYVLELCQDDKLKDILYPGWKKEERAAPAFPDEEEILRQFNIKEDKHHYFNTDGATQEAQEQYVRSFLLAKFVDDCIERPGHQQEDSMAHEMAYKMTIFWRGNLDEVNKYLERTNYYATNQALHDSLASTDIAADGKKVTLDAWRRLILTKDAKAVLDNFGNADRIQEKLGRPPANTGEIQETAMKLQYARAEENPEMAVVFRKYKVSEEIFNRCLEIDARKKTRDNLPDVSINGADVGHPGYHLVKLPIDDPRAYILGKITSCCQSIGDHSERCVIDGVTRENNGFYVLLKEKKNTSAVPFLSGGKINYEDFDIVGQGYAWKTQAGNICFDSWENDGIEVDSKRESSDKVICELLPAYARAVEIMGVDRVSIGCGGKTPQEYQNKARAETSELMFEGYAYGDADVQVEIGTSSTLVSAREKLLQFTPGKPVSQFVSVKSIEAFRALPDELIKQLLSNPNYELLTGPLMFPATDANKFYEDILKDRKKMQVLTSDDATRAYQTGAVKASDLMHLDRAKMYSLISINATIAYKTGAVTASDLMDLDLGKISALTSDDATRAYQTGAVTASDLKGLSLKEIEALTSPYATRAYQTGAVTASDLLSKTPRGIYINILQKIAKYYCQEDITIPEEIDYNIIRALTSHRAILAYKTGAVTASDLMHLDPKKIQALTSRDATRAYKTRAVTASDLKGLSLKEIEALTSRDAIHAYDTRAVTASDLKGLSLKEIEALTSRDAIYAYDTGAVKASDLKGLGLPKIQALTSYFAAYAYRSKVVEPQQIMHLAADKIGKFFKAIRALQESGEEINVQQILASPQFSEAKKPLGQKIKDIASKGPRGISAAVRVIDKLRPPYLFEDLPGTHKQDKSGNSSKER